MIAEKVNDEIILFDTTWADKPNIMAVPGSSFEKNAWRVPLGWGGCLALRGIFGTRLQVGPELSEWSRLHKEHVVDVGMSLRSTLQYDRPPPVEDRLYPFQEPGRDFLARVSWAVLGDEMGTGKTIQLLAAADYLDKNGFDVFPILVICPNSVKTHWATHAADRIPDCKTFIIGGGVKKRRDLLADAARTSRAVVIINIDAVRLHSRLAPFGSISLSATEKEEKELNHIPFRTGILDEAHRIASPKSKWTRAVWSTMHNKSMRFRWAATGTPIRDNVTDFWSILHAVAPHEFPNKTKFVDRYAWQRFDPFGGMKIVGVQPATKDEFFSLVDPHFRRMPKDLVLPFLPDKVRVIREAEMSAKQAKAYKEMSKEQVVQVDDGRLILATNDLVKNTRLLQFSSAYANVQDDGSVRLTDPSSKIDQLLEIIEDAGKPIVVCAESRQLLELASRRLEKHSIDHRMLVGGMSDDQRAAVIKDFATGRIPIFMFTIKAGGTGVDGLQHAADTLVFLQRSWSLVDNLQAEDRIHRIGSEVHDSITIIDVVAPGTVEVDQIGALYEKASRLQEIVRDKATMYRAAEMGDEHAQRAVAQMELEISAIYDTPLWAA